MLVRRARVREQHLEQVLRLDTTSAGSRMLAGPRRGRRAFFLRAETAHTLTERLGGRLGFWDEDTHP